MTSGAGTSDEVDILCLGLESIMPIAWANCSVLLSEPLSHSPLTDHLLRLCAINCLSDSSLVTPDRFGSVINSGDSSSKAACLSEGSGLPEEQRKFLYPGEAENPCFRVSEGLDCPKDSIIDSRNDTSSTRGIFRAPRILRAHHPASQPPILDTRTRCTALVSRTSFPRSASKPARR